MTKVDNILDTLTDIFLQEQWSNWRNYHTDLPPNFAIYQLQPHQPHTDYPQVVVCWAMEGMSLTISYFIENKSWLDFADFDEKNFEPADFLWEQNCLECFFELNDSQNYFETNISPTGAFNFYDFDDYRTPNQMPPRQNKHLQLLLSPRMSNLENWHERHFSIRLNHYFMQKINEHGDFFYKITKINPTVILYQNNEPIFYAVKHANPPDFHDKNFWLDF